MRTHRGGVGQGAVPPLDVGVRDGRQRPVEQVLDRDAADLQDPRHLGLGFRGVDGGQR